MACIVEELYFNDWEWRVTARRALGVQTTKVIAGYSIEFDKNQIGRTAWVPELLFIEGSRRESEAQAVCEPKVELQGGPWRQVSRGCH